MRANRNDTDAGAVKPRVETSYSGDALERPYYGAGRCLNENNLYGVDCEASRYIVAISLSNIVNKKIRDKLPRYCVAGCLCLRLPTHVTCDASVRV